MKKNTIKKLEKEAKKYFKWENGCHDFDHTDRVRKLALHIWKIENADMEVLEIAALLHDIGRKEELKCRWKVCHAELWAKKAKKILEEFEIEKEKLDNIIHCIETHRFRKWNIPETLEAKILYDADKLDWIWAIWIGRLFTYASSIWAKLHNKDVELENTKEYSRDDTPRREFALKRSKVKDKMQTNEWKKLAKERHEFMVQFFDRLNKEVDWEI